LCLCDLIERLRGVESDFWREKLAGVGSVSGLEDLSALPFTGKDEFR
jgi:hypothetical protein